jgi:arsenate reductase
MSDRCYNVLFLCTRNSASSILAELILQKDGAGRFRAFSAGSHSKGVVNPFALMALANHHYPSFRFRSKSWGRIRGARRASNGFRLHRLQRRGGRSLPGLVWPAHDGTLGD